MIEEVKVDEVKVTAEIKWTCPECGYKNEMTYDPGPYQAIADNPSDEMCKGCENFFTLNFFS